MPYSLTDYRTLYIGDFYGSPKINLFGPNYYIPLVAQGKT